MKRFVFFLILSGLFFTGSCQKELDNSSYFPDKLSDISLMSIVDPNDPNLNANWNFSDPNVTTAKIYFGERINGNPVSGVDVSLPWFTLGNPVNNQDRDYRPELGWVLYLKDFGTTDRPTQTPFFALYNKYSGVLRFFVYNYRVRNQGEASKTYYIGELGFNNTSDYNSSLSFFSPTNEFVKSKTNPNTKQIVVTKKDASDLWLNLDFTMVYDTKFSELLLNVYGVNQADLALGTDFSTLSARSSVGGAGNTSDFHNAVQKGYEYTGATKSLLDAINELLKKKNPTSSSNQISINKKYVLDGSQENVAPQAVPIATVAAAIGVVQSVIGLVKSFSGGKKSTTSTQTVIQYSGIVNTTGTATISNNLYSIQFHQNPNAPLTAQRYKPIYNNLTGLIGAPESFTLLAQEFQYSYPCALHEHRELRVFTYNSGFRFDKFVDAFFNNTDLVGKVRITKFDTYLVNNNITEIGLTAEHNSFSFLNEAHSNYNSGMQGSDVHSLPKNAGRYRDNDDVDIVYGRYVYPTNWYNAPFGSTIRYPKIGVEIHYEIIDPAYPLADSKERVIFKVLDPSSLDFRPHTGNPITGNCPQPYIHVY